MRLGCEAPVLWSDLQFAMECTPRGRGWSKIAVCFQDTQRGLEEAHSDSFDLKELASKMVYKPLPPNHLQTTGHMSLYIQNYTHSIPLREVSWELRT